MREQKPTNNNGYFKGQTDARLEAMESSLDTLKKSHAEQVTSQHDMEVRLIQSIDEKFDTVIEKITESHTVINEKIDTAVKPLNDFRSRMKGVTAFIAATISIVGAVLGAILGKVL